MEKFGIKVFGRGGGGKPFLRKVSPDKSHIYVFTSITHKGAHFLSIESCHRLLGSFRRFNAPYKEQRPLSAVELMLLNAYFSCNSHP